MGSSDKTSKNFRPQDSIRPHARNPQHSSLGPVAANRSTMPGSAMVSDSKNPRGKPMARASVMPMSSLMRVGDKKGSSSKKASPSSSSTKGKDGKSKSSKEASAAAAKQLHIFPRRKAGQDKRHVGSGSAVVLTLEVLQKYSEVPLIQAAKSLGISKTALKSACRNLGLERWPFRRHCEATADNKDDGDASVASTASAAHSRSASLGPPGSSNSRDKRRAKEEDDNDLGWMCVTPDLSDSGSFEDQDQDQEQEQEQDQEPEQDEHRDESESPHEMEASDFNFSEGTEEAELSQGESEIKGSGSPVIMPPRLDRLELDYTPSHQHQHERRDASSSHSLADEAMNWQSDDSEEYPLHIRGEMMPFGWKPIPMAAPPMAFSYHDISPEMRMIGV